MKGLLLVNLGTPDSPGVKDVWRYLIEFLTDGRVIDFSWWKRQLLVRGIIIPLRVKSSASSYQAIWTEKGSPLMFHSQSATYKLQKLLGEEWKVELAMRYQTPSIKEGLEKLKGCSEIVVLPLFPQYASATTGSIFEKVMVEIKKWLIIPELSFINSFYDHPAVIKAYASQAKDLKIEKYDKILFSFHGLPLRHLIKANPQCKNSKDCCSPKPSCYSAQCYITAKAIAKELKLPDHQWEVSFQSRLGKEIWMEPYTSDTLNRMGEEGVKSILVFCPAFVADCLETLHEIGVEYAEEFKHKGGERLDLVPSLNDSEEWIHAMKDLVTTK